MQYMCRNSTVWWEKSNSDARWRFEVWSDILCHWC